MILPNIHNYKKLSSVHGNPDGYVTKDGMWAAVPWEKKFVIIFNGQQVHTANNYKSALSYIQKEIKSFKKKTSGPLDKFI